MIRFLVLSLLLATSAFGFQPDRPQSGPPAENMAPATLIFGLKPKYPDEAKAAHAQGTVVLQVLIDERGIPAQIAVLSPLGYGMDEAAIAAVAQWRYQPTTQDGKAVGVITQITINYSLDGASFDKKEERQRTAYNVALSQIKQNKVDKKTVDSLRDLAVQKFAPGMYLCGIMLEEGRGEDKNPDQGFQPIQASAEKKHGPALYDVAKAMLAGDRLPKDPTKVWS